MLNEVSPAATRDEARVLLRPPTSRDTEAIQKLLVGAGLDCVVCPTMSALCQELLYGAGTVVVSEEALSADHGSLAAWVSAQPVWSDLPIVILAGSGAEAPTLSRVLASLGNVNVLERPMRVSSFLSVVRSALRARERQYQVRDYLAERERNEGEREALLSSERAARDDAERASTMKDEFLATLSHELRTPLTAILGWAQILKMHGANAKDVGQGINVIERNARVQTQIIEDLLDMNRIISGKIRLDVQEVDLASVVKEAIETVQPAAHAKDIRIIAVLGPLGTPVSGDPSRLQQVFWNLLSNAVKFTPKGGKVQVVLKRVNSHLEVTMTDSGEGIDPTFLPNVFDRFRQADATTTRRHGGLGLGLAIVKQLVELHGGSVRANSPGTGRGSTFTVLLPLSVVVGAPEPLLNPRYPTAETVPIAPSTCTKLAGLRVLIVDDDADARTLLRRLLEDCEATVYAATSAAEALTTLQSERPDVLVSDIGMPNEDGHALIRRVRTLPPDRGGNIPAVALTAYARAEDRVNAILAGFQHHLSKPVEPAELIAVVASLSRRIPVP